MYIYIYMYINGCAPSRIAYLGHAMLGPQGKLGPNPTGTRLKNIMPCRNGPPRQRRLDRYVTLPQKMRRPS